MDDAAALCRIKAEFAGAYSGGAHIQEVLPGLGSILPAHLGKLREFARANPIYHSHAAADILGVRCDVLEGDINEYWLGSTKHGSSCQPFYPTWLASAYIVCKRAKELGCAGLVDIGSGDGRIAYCAALLGMGCKSIEIDPALASLQRDISAATGVRFNPECADALGYDYARLGLGDAAFAIGGLPQMGGDMLACGVIEAVKRAPKLANPRLVLAGTRARRRLASGGGDAGWGETVSRHGLTILDTVTLPTVWTFDQDEDTPYVFARL